MPCRFCKLKPEQMPTGTSPLKSPLPKNSKDPLGPTNYNMPLICKTLKKHKKAAGPCGALVNINKNV